MSPLAAVSSPSASWEIAKRLRLIIILGLLVMVTTGSTALAGSDTLEGVSEERIFITLPIYVSSIITVGGACFLLGRWTKGRETAAADLMKDHEALKLEVGELRNFIENQAHGKTQRDHIDTP